MTAGRERGWQDRVVLVTGIGGFVGSSLARELLARGARVVGIVRDSAGLRKLELLGIHRRVDLITGDISDPGLVSRCLSEYEVDSIYHLAAQTSSQIARRSPVPTFESNVSGTWHVLEAARLSPLVRSVVVASTDAVPDEQTVGEQGDGLGLGVQPYDASKLCADLLARSYAATYPLPVATVRCARVYGPGDTNWSRLVPGAVRQALAGEDPVVRGDGKVEGDYLYVTDAVEGYLSAGEHLPEISGSAVRLGSGQRTSVLGLVRMILAEVGDPGLQPRVLNENGVEPIPPRQALDNARKLLSWRPRVGLAEGLALTVAWYRDYLSAGKVLAISGGR